MEHATAGSSESESALEGYSRWVESRYVAAWKRCHSMEARRKAKVDMIEARRALHSGGIRAAHKFVRQALSELGERPATHNSLHDYYQRLAECG